MWLKTPATTVPHSMARGTGTGTTKPLTGVPTSTPTRAPTGLAAARRVVISGGCAVLTWRVAPCVGVAAEEAKRNPRAVAIRARNLDLLLGKQPAERAGQYLKIDQGDRLGPQL